MNNRSILAIILIGGLIAGLSLFFVLGFLNFGAESREETPAPKIISCDSSGAEKNFFITGETIYFKGSGFNANITAYVYVVSDVNWTDGMPIPARVANTTTEVATDASGNFGVTKVWHSAVHGQYDIVVDTNGDGKYNSAIDALDNNNIVGAAGFLVTPEYPLGAVLALAACFAAFAVINRKSLSLPKRA
jgi:hypothetical protein